MSTPLPRALPGQNVLVQDGVTTLSPGVVLKGYPNGTADIMAFTTGGVVQVAVAPFYDTSSNVARPSKCWNYNFVTP